MSVLGNDTIKPCSRSRPYAEPPSRKLVQGGGVAANTSCGFYDGDPDRPLVPPPGMGCTTNEATRVWGFCPTRGGSTMDPGPLGRSDPGSVASSCKLTATCYDSFACKAGCGVSVSGGAVGDEGGRDAVDETGHAVNDEGADAVDQTAHAVEDGAADGGQDEDGDGGGDEDQNDVAPHLPHISGRALPRMICMGQEATRYCNMALWIRHDNVRFTSLACGTVAGSTASIFENPWAAAAATRKPPSATAGVVSSGTLTTTPSLSPFPSSGPVGSTGRSVTTHGRAVATSGRRPFSAAASVTPPSEHEQKQQKQQQQQ
ncbi:hypothetical protein MAPG_00456 [Magnaporthiopsis poae ATCC 64411]|uniref:Uncharacterized protein n=1 Tax=Magnaporthiopsis poae (strain ATCC 64411 / 73-15) TaxID=644358 RepID=A0A0C4DL22_MAGP6|nr:hypothetical protein MAPG_00456 [Magnaporthiopsis poae ATCC 64411]